MHQAHSYVRANLAAFMLMVKSSHYLNYRPSVFQELYHLESAYPEKVPTAQLTRNTLLTGYSPYL
jgi:hypothetical protein